GANASHHVARESGAGISGGFGEMQQARSESDVFTGFAAAGQSFQMLGQPERIGAANFSGDGILEKRLVVRTSRGAIFAAALTFSLIFVAPLIIVAHVFNSSFQPLLNCVPVSYRDSSDGDTHPLTGSAHGTVELLPYSH